MIFTDLEKIEILRIMNGLADTLDHNKVDPNLAATATMMLTARMAVHSNQTNAVILDEFRKTLENSRVLLNVPEPPPTH